ncbi:MAG: leucyl aminopeptidase [Deltaproteobacteria bacterium]|jgi:leucyl aminopeptidase|nr:leucyl aminopeptidase [Deltaproteobacteria bacterium]
MDIIFQTILNDADCILIPVFSNKDPLAFFEYLGRSMPWIKNTPTLRDFKGKKDATALAYLPEDAYEVLNSLKNEDGQKLHHPQFDVELFMDGLVQNVEKVQENDSASAHDDRANGYESSPRRVLFCGMGKIEDFKADVLRDAVASGLKICAELKLKRLLLSVESIAAILHVCSGKKNQLSFAGLIEESVLGALLSLYSRELYKSNSGNADDNPHFIPDSLTLLCLDEAMEEQVISAAQKAQAIATGITLARNLINGPANIVTPSYLEIRAQNLSRRYHFTCTSLGPDYLRKERLGAFLAVTKGSEEEPRLLILEHKPDKAKNKDKPIIIIGKGITFDSGGICLKPSAGMHEMTSDMAGAGTVLGLFAALGEASLAPSTKKLTQLHIVGIMPCAENMPDGKASHPGDIVTTLAGKTVEITNTDAEGRLLLCDCLTLAQTRWTPSSIIDMATLTGACVVALGEKTTGLFGNNEELRDKLMQLSAKNSERFWPMPIYDEDLEILKSNTADLNNVGPREGGALFAALFLKQFVDKNIPWAHLDIAGPAFTDKKSPVCPGGASGVALRTLFEYIISQA